MTSNINLSVNSSSVNITLHSLEVAFAIYKARTLICRTNQWTGFYMIGTSVMKELIYCRSSHAEVLCKKDDHLKPLTIDVSHHIETSQLIRNVN